MFLGYDLGPGLRWTQIYRFLDYESLKKGTFQEVTSREIVIPQGPWQFPLAEAKDEAMAVFGDLEFPQLVQSLRDSDAIDASASSKSLPSSGEGPIAADSDKQPSDPSDSSKPLAELAEGAPEEVSAPADSVDAAEKADSVPSRAAPPKGDGPDHDSLKLGIRKGKYTINYYCSFP